MAKRRSRFIEQSEAHLELCNIYGSMLPLSFPDEGVPGLDLIFHISYAIITLPPNGNRRLYGTLTITGAAPGGNFGEAVHVEPCDIYASTLWYPLSFSVHRHRAPRYHPFGRLTIIGDAPGGNFGETVRAEVEA